MKGFLPSIAIWTTGGVVTAWNRYSTISLTYLTFRLEARFGESVSRSTVRSLWGTTTICEAKWQEAAAIQGDLRDLDGAVGSSLDNTLGLFISINGFSRDAIDSYVQGSRPKIICMDGGDVMLVVENRIELPELLQRKKDLASEKRRVFVPAEEILRGAA